MFCESHRAALSEAALCGERLCGDAEEHLASCASCRKWFSEEQALFGLLNIELGALANADVPALLVPRVRNQIAARAESWVWRSPLLAYVAALTVAAIVFSFAARSRAPLVREKKLVGEASASAPTGQNTPPAQNESVPQLLIGHRQPIIRQGLAVQAQLEVLVSADEQLGLQRYVASLKPAEAGHPAVVTTDAATEIAPLGIAGIDVRRLSIEPLESGEAN